MGKRNPKPTDAELARAAEMRTGGETWQKVADELGRTLTAVKQWPGNYSDRWLPLLAMAEAELLQDLNSESLLTLRQLLRSKSDPVRQRASDAVRKLLGDLPEGRAGRIRESPVPEIRQLVAYLETLSEGQFREYFDPPADDPPPPALAG